MSINLTVDLCIYLLSNARSFCGQHRRKQLHFLYSPKLYWKTSYVSLQRGFHPHKIRCKWTKSETCACSKQYYPPGKHDLHIGILKLSASAPKGLTKVSIRMSRIKSTLNSVSKAVFGKQNEMISRLAQFKPSSRIFRKVSESGWLKEGNIKQAIRSLKKYSDKSTEKSSVPEDKGHVPDKEETSKQSLFHYTGTITTKFGESFYFLSNHINSYFKREEKMSQNKEDRQMEESGLEGKKVEEGKSGSVDPGALVAEAGPESSPGTVDKAASPSSAAEALPVSTKQTIANFLSRPTEGVQALVGGYIGGLVPKLKYDSKSQAEDQEEPKAESTSSRDKAGEAKKHLSLQREKIIARVSIDNRTRALVQALRRTSDPKLCITRVEELTFHLLEFPEGKGVAVKERIIPYLLRLRQMKDETLQAAVREILALIGYVDPVKGRGIRILTIDGGGTR